MKELRVIVVVDTSGSAKYETIARLNRFFEEAAICLREKAALHQEIKISVGGIQYSTNVRYLFKNFWKVVDNDFYFPVLNASGHSNFMKALNLLYLSLLLSEISKDSEQIIIYFTDGYFTDDWLENAQNINNYEAYKRSKIEVYVMNDFYNFESIKVIAGDSMQIVTKNHIGKFIELLERVYKGN